jgi:hypothetical protein
LLHQSPLCFLASPRPNQTKDVHVRRLEIIAFAAQFDPQPFHLDEEAARKSVFGGLVASGWHTAALTMRLVVEGEFRPAGGVLGVQVAAFLDKMSGDAVQIGGKPARKLLGRLPVMACGMRQMF